jgi:hypothetical protein
MDAKAFFVSTLNELEEKCETGSMYDLIRISGILRLLLLDGEPLAHRVNRSFRKKIKFTVQKRDGLTPKLGQLALHGINPHPSLPTEFLDLDGFLALKVLSFHQFSYSVHELIDFTAHKRGGVHFGEGRKKSDKERAFDTLYKSGIKLGYLKSEPSDVVVALMVPIALATIEALSEIKTLIVQGGGATGASASASTP